MHNRGFMTKYNKNFCYICVPSMYQDMFLLKMETGKSFVDASALGITWAEFI